MMISKAIALTAALSWTTLVSAAEAESPAPADATVPLHPGLGSASISITTTSEHAQQYFDQGLRLMYGFWFAEARRSFEEAIRQDPEAAMAYWGKAIAFGPWLNRGIVTPKELETSYEAIQQALARRSKTTALERGLIEALSTRFAKDPASERAPLDQAYADAMKSLLVQFPDDVNVLTLTADAYMNTTRWDYWTENGKAKPGTQWLVETLEHALEIDPRHSGAIHFYIHAVEASNNPRRAREPARTLASTAPGNPHLVHMGSHILIQTGDYDHAGDTNIDASSADELYIGRPDQEGVYPLFSYQHNVHFVWSAGSFEGRSRLAVQQARKLRDKVFGTMPHDIIASSTRLQNYMASHFYALVRFGYWDDILAEPAPPERFRFVTGMWHYARGIALGRNGRYAEARAEQEKLDEIIQGDILEGPSMMAQGMRERGSSPYTQDTENLLLLASNAMAGEIATDEARWDDAIASFEKAVELQDKLAYSEPPPWHYPVRHSLGATLLGAGRPEAAEAVYRDDLKKWPENGWALYGLMQSLRAQGRMTEARLVEQRFLKAWTRADVALTASRF